MTEKTIYFNPPAHCAHCEKKFGDTMYDAKTAFGWWANLCEECFGDVGLGLGTGRGQKYVLNEEQWVKIDG